MPARQYIDAAQNLLQRESRVDEGRPRITRLGGEKL